ncbi:hypothetical protein EDB92DRAFT_1449369 [Lactarius akahatsu]|uniref:Uncharacterized protein n=1 Tax=Lactarius akahatsu TaxID=416441 RepID=A0AAD4QGL9_9AGAM|nr:hypothetical protein EDB92DRAFT_1449369 [Lactarius akahatsu]
MGISVSVMSPPTLDDGVDDLSGLHGHAMRDDVAAVSAFLSSNEGTDINVRDEYGYTALHLAADRGNVAVVEFLLKQGADKTLKVRAHDMLLSFIDCSQNNTGHGWIYGNGSGHDRPTTRRRRLTRAHVSTYRAFVRQVEVYESIKGGGDTCVESAPCARLR